MKNQKRILSLGAAAALLLGNTFAANAELLTQGSVSTIKTTEDIKNSSTVYVGEVVVDGISKIKYVYSADLAHNEVAWNDLADSLQGMSDGDFAGLFPSFDSDSDEKGLKLCSVGSYAADMDSTWASASAVGEKYYRPALYELTAESSDNLYDVDTGFKAKLDGSKAARAENIDEPIDNSKTLVSHLDSRTVTDVYYTIENGTVTRHSDINVVYDSEEITVIYTKAEMKSRSNTRINVTGKQAKVVQDSTLYVGEIVVDGESAVKYLWSDDITRSETVAAAVKSGLFGLDDKDFAGLVPVIIGEEGKKGWAQCSVAAYAADMSESWKNAESVAGLYYPALTVKAASSGDLYATNKGFADACAFEENVEIVDTAGEAYEQRSPLAKLTATNTDNVTYTVEDGELIKYIDRFIDYTCEAVKVVYTRVELESPTAKHTVTFKDAENDQTLMTCNIPDGSSISDYFNEDVNRMKPLYTYDESTGKYYAPKTLTEDRAGTEHFAMLTGITEDKTLYVGFVECTGEVNITLEAPICGTVVTSTSASFADEPEQTNAPKVTVADPNCEAYPYWTENLLVDPENGYYRIYSGNIKGGETYNALIAVFAGRQNGKLLSMFPKVTVNGKAVPDEQVLWNEGLVFITTDIEAVHDLVKTEAKAPTAAEAGNTEFFTCRSCGKLYSDAQGRSEISPEATVIAPSQASSESSKTDSSSTPESSKSESSKTESSGSTAAKNNNGTSAAATANPNTGMAGTVSIAAVIAAAALVIKKRK